MSAPVLLTCAAVVLAVLGMMALEAQLSAHNERLLRSKGAVEPAGDGSATSRSPRH